MRAPDAEIVAGKARVAVLLDALGTLVQLEPPAPQLRRELAHRFGIIIDDTQAERAIAAEITYYRAHFGEGRDADSVTVLRGRCAEALRAALPATDALTRLDNGALTEALLASIRFHPFPEVHDALAAARRRGQRLAVVSNWDVSLHDVLARLELAPLLDAIVTSAEVGARKPEPAIFAVALRTVRAEPWEAVHVGDSFEDDVEGARRAGVQAVLIRRDGGAGPPGVPTIATLSELEPFLRVT